MKLFLIKKLKHYINKNIKFYKQNFYDYPQIFYLSQTNKH